MSPSEFTLQPQLPRPRRLQQLLNLTTERLCAECARATSVAPQWQAFLSHQARHTLARHGCFVTVRDRIDAEARRRGLAVVALKGIALHDLKLYRPGERPMADIDLLVRDSDLAAADELLGSLGYRERNRNRRERVYVPLDSQDPTGFGEHTRNILKIELHTRIAERLPVRTIDITRLLLPRPGAVGLQGYDTLATLMTHLLLHGAGNMRSRSLRCLQLNDIAVLSGRLERADWDQVLYHERQFGSGWVYPLLALTSRYYTDVAPVEVLREAAAQCHHGLRRASARQHLSDVSLSRSWIDFAPGMEWCGSLAEKLHFARSRVFPDPVMRAEIAACETIQVWAQESHWFRLSRPRRVVRWLLSRPQRVATIASVRKAWRADSAPERAA
jgi:hypothetical protein